MPEPRATVLQSPEPTEAWLVALDTGGTFTDIVARAPDGSVRRAKVPSDGTILVTLRPTGGTRAAFAATAALALPDAFLEGWSLVDLPEARVKRQTSHEIEFTAIPGDRLSGTARLIPDGPPVDAPRLGLHIVTGTPLGGALPPIEIRLSTTRGTNALLEGRGARVGVLVSHGLTGVVEIGDQTREDLFARVPRRARRIAHAVMDLPERSLCDGSVDRLAAPEDCLRAARGLAGAGCTSVVVSLAHALANDRERTIASGLRAHGIAAIAASEVAAHPRLLTRTETACVHAQIEPILGAFVADATRSAATARPFVFTSAGVLQRAERLLARDTLYSGPAGGARAVCDLARTHAIARAIGFDMGGTSADVSRVSQGAIALRGESRINRMTVAAPSVAIDSVAAGGGSICRITGGMFEVGPESAGANPGPACYGRGGPLTLTDVNVLAGRIPAGHGALGLDRRLAQRALDAIELGPGADRRDALGAFLDIANARMALAIESLCVRDGVDPRGHSLVAFGGAGGQHACAIADRLGLAEVVFPRFAGFMCAHGVFSAEPARFATAPVLRALDACAGELGRIRDQAVRAAARELAEDGFPRDAQVSVRASLRLTGQESSIEVAFGEADSMRADFERRFIDIFGYEPPRRAVEVVSVEARAATVAANPAPPCEPGAAAGVVDDGASARSTVTMLSEGRWSDAQVLARAGLRVGQVVAGPAVITDAGETVVVDRSWSATLDGSGDLVARRTAPPLVRTSVAEQELFAARLESIAVSMGNVLERTALNPNIRDRLDFSCAVLDAEGTLIQNAPHLPVHLGALGVCTRAVMKELDLAEGDIAVTNHPAFGGSHLPDVTTVAPVHVDGARIAFVAVRAHHAEIGGTRPGSFPPDARSLAEEGVVLPPFAAVRSGTFDADGCRARFAGGAFPSRNPDENLADLQAQIAATRYGVKQVAALARELSGAFASRCAGELARADESMRRALATCASDGASARCILDDGSAIEASIAVGRTGAASTARIRIASPTLRHASNFNAPLAVTRAAVLYALRLLIDRPVPMNEGLLRGVDLLVPECMLNPRFSVDPAECPPVVAGNVETSQSVVSALLACMGFAAESQSTMNNVLFGNDRFTIYETLGGGAGAGAGLPGADAVHVHMSNTRLTDIDVLERRAPVVIRRFVVRAGSGGKAASRGGDGMVRAYEFREGVSLSFFGSRRRSAPKGVEGGSDGSCGLQRALVGGHAVESHDPVLSLELAAGDTFTVETPGGGGFGA